MSFRPKGEIFYFRAVPKGANILGSNEYKYKAFWALSQAQNNVFEALMMREKKEKIRHLKKVHLSLETGKYRDLMDLTPEPLRFDFIFGLGVEGLSPFEFELAEKEVGETITLSIQRDQIPETFGHLTNLLPAFPGDVKSFYLKVRVLELSEVDQREVIKSMANTAGCHDHCC